jgi:hypothetical protein
MHLLAPGTGTCACVVLLVLTEKAQQPIVPGKVSLVELETRVRTLSQKNAHYVEINVEITQQNSELTKRIQVRAGDARMEECVAKFKCSIISFLCIDRHSATMPSPSKCEVLGHG